MKFERLTAAGQWEDCAIWHVYKNEDTRLEARLSLFSQDVKYASIALYVKQHRWQETLYFSNYEKYLEDCRSEFLEVEHKKGWRNNCAKALRLKSSRENRSAGCKNRGKYVPTF